MSKEPNHKGGAILVVIAATPIVLAVAVWWLA